MYMLQLVYTPVNGTEAEWIQRPHTAPRSSRSKVQTLSGVHSDMGGCSGIIVLFKVYITKY